MRRQIDSVVSIGDREPENCPGSPSRAFMQANLWADGRAGRTWAGEMLPCSQQSRELLFYRFARMKKLRFASIEACHLSGTSSSR